MSYIKPNFYEILNVSPNATADELKTKYKQMILKCHPDKLQQQQQQLENHFKNLEIKDDPNSLEFVALTEAWNCLKDPIKRKQYDAELLLNKFHTHNNIYAHITLKEMKKVTNSKDYHFQDDDDDDEELSINENKEENKKTETSKYLYTYDCRCGGQYIVDESVEQYCRSGNNHHYFDIKIKNTSDKDNNGVGDDDDANPNTQNNKNSPNIKKYNNNGGSGDGGNDGGSSEGVVFIQDNDEAPKTEAAAAEVDDDDDGELIVECSECSLVIILNG